MSIASTAATVGNPALAQFVLSVASGATVVLLAFLVRTLRKFMREHEWLIRTVDEHGKAIKQLLEERPSPRRGR